MIYPIKMIGGISNSTNHNNHKNHSSDNKKNAQGKIIFLCAFFFKISLSSFIL